MFQSNKQYPNGQIDNNKTVWMDFAYSYIFKVVNRNDISLINIKIKIMDVKKKNRYGKECSATRIKTSPNKKINKYREDYTHGERN